MSLPTSYFSSTTGNLAVFESSTGDQSIESAVKGTFSSPPTINSFNDILANINVNLINPNYGTQGVSTDNSEDLRGYPYVTLDPNFELDFEYINAYTTKRVFLCKPTINYAVGYNITITMQVNLYYAGANHYTNYTIYIPAGSTVASSVSPAPTYSGGRFKINNVDPSVTYPSINATATITYDGFFTSTNYSQNYNLTYDTSTIYSYNSIFYFSAVNCSGYKLSEQEMTFYSTANALELNSTYYSDSGLTTKVSSGVYAQVTASYTKAFYIDANGNITNIITCYNA